MCACAQACVFGLSEPLCTTVCSCEYVCTHLDHHYRTGASVVCPSRCFHEYLCTCEEPRYIPITRFVRMMRGAPYPFGLRRPDGAPMTTAECVRHLKLLNVPVYAVPASKLRDTGADATPTFAWHQKWGVVGIY